MSRRLTIFLIQVTIFALLLIWSVNIQPLQAQTPTTTPQPAQTATPIPRPTIPLGVNFWDPIAPLPSPTPLVPSQSLFPTPGAPEHRGGYVLLMKEDVDYHPSLITTTINSGLTPVIRYDDGERVVPVDDDEIDNWKGRFLEFITTYPQVNLFIVGNEPWLGVPPIKLEQYARAYVELWQEVHGSPTNKQRSEVFLLVAGQGAHQSGGLLAGDEGIDTVNWPGEVSKRIVELGADVDGYALHAYGFGREYTDQWPLRPVDVPDIAAALWQMVAVGEGTPTPDPQNPLPSCPAPWKADQACDNLGGGWLGDDGFLNFQDQLASLPPEFAGKPVYITEYNTNAWGTGDGRVRDFGDVMRPYSQHEPISPYMPANNYPAGWIIDAANSVDAYNSATPAPQNRIEGMMWFVGSPHGGIDKNTGIL